MDVTATQQLFGSKRLFLSVYFYPEATVDRTAVAWPTSK
jgi:hypothetical protein